MDRYKEVIMLAISRLCYNITYHLPHLEDIIFRDTTDHPGLIRVPCEVRNLCSMATVNELKTQNSQPKKSQYTEISIPKIVR